MKRRGRTATLGPLAVVAVLALPLALFFLAMPPARAFEPAQVTQRASEIFVDSAASAVPRSVTPPPPVTTTVPASDPTDTSPDWEQRWGEAALARMSYPWAQVGFRINFFGATAGYYGKTLRSAREIDIYVRPGESFELLRHVVAHELGHAIDIAYNNPARHRRWQELRGIDTSTPWVVWNQMDFATPAGDFAETFAAWQVGDSNRSRMAPAPDGATMAALVPLFFPEN